MSDREQRFSRLAIVALIATGVAGAAMAARQMYGEYRRIAPSPAPPVLYQVPGFSLIRETGTGVSNSDLIGKVWIADFIFTRCAGPCPMMTQRMSELQDSLRKFPGVRLVTFTVDPEHDTAEVLADYGRDAGADPARWMFLTGDRTAIYDLAIKGFKMAIDRDVDYERQIIHSTRLVIVDRRGRVRSYHDGVENVDLEALVNDVRAVYAE